MWQRHKQTLNYSVIKAPFDGTIGISQVKVGNTVSVGQTVLNTISTDDPMAVDFVVNEKQIPRFVQLEAHKPNPADSIFTIALPDNSLYNYDGQIHVIDRGVNPQTGTIIVRLVFPNPSWLRAGMSCTVRVRNDDTAQQLLVPKSNSGADGRVLYVRSKGYADSHLAPIHLIKKMQQPPGPSLHAIQRK